MKKGFKFTINAMAVTGLLISGAASVTAQVGEEGPDTFTHSDKIAVKKATARYHSVKQAEKAGYVNTGECVALPGVGAMGIHFLNNSLVDGEVDMTKPEVLLYEPTSSGLKLVGVEYLSTGPNELFGQTFDPPHGPIPYSLHTWVWEENPLGTFIPFNPNVACPR